MTDLRDRLYIASFCDGYREIIKEYGLGLEINQTCISERLDEDKREDLISEITDDIRETGTDRVIMHGPFTEIIPEAIDPLMRSTGLRRLEEAWEAASRLGLRKMVVHTGWMPQMYFKSWQAEKSAEFWQEFMKDKPEDMVLAVENVLDDEPFMIRDMMQRISDSRIRLCLDVGHANAKTLREYDVFDWIRELGPMIAHVHLHNNDGKDDCHSALPDGTMDMEAVIWAIEEHCPDDITYTIESADALKSVEWLKIKGFI